MRHLSKIVLTALFAICLSTSVMAAEAQKIHKDSTWLNAEAVLSTNVQKSAAVGGVPVGTVIIWPVASNPPGFSTNVNDTDWLECNGQAVPTVYPELRGLTSNAPNYQGMFLRGYGSQNHTKNNGSTIGNTNTNHASGQIGVIQGDAIRDATGQFSYPGGSDHSGWGVFNSAITDGSDGSASIATTGARSKIRPDTPNYTNPQFNLYRVHPTANEIRPVNIAIRYLIRSR